MVYVVIVLLLICIVAGILGKRAAKQRESGCGSGCEGCAFHSSCENNEKKL